MLQMYYYIFTFFLFKLWHVSIVYFAKGEPRNVEYCKVFLWKCNIWVLRTSKLSDAKFFIHSIFLNWPN